jgi:diacylglycerol kinase family enzyme
VRFIAVLNRDGGTLRTMDLDLFCAEARAVFERHGHVLDCKVVAGAAVESALHQAAEDQTADALLAGGGDGTISSAAGIAFETGRPLAVLPAGTMNLFARALRVPLELNDALEAIAAGTVGTADIATANGRPFVHQFGVGIHARLVRIRENMTYRSRLGKMLASLRAIGAAAVNPPRFEVELHTQKGVHRQKVSGIAVSNNPLANRQIHAGGLNAGLLGVYLVAPMTTWGVLRLAASVLLGSWRDSPMVSEAEVEAVTLTFPKRKRTAQAVVDGELRKLERTVVLQLHANGLRVIRPGHRSSEMPN